MIYPPLLVCASPDEYRQYYEREYCHDQIRTFDGFLVRFRKNCFGHFCYESSFNDSGKDQFSEKRAQRIPWIKVALSDENAELYLGFDKAKRLADDSRRVAIVQENFVVVIAFTGQWTADFITAMVADRPPRLGRPSNLQLLRLGPKWTKKNR